MATRLQLRKGTTTEHSTFKGANGEVTVDTTKKTLVLHDGVTAGGKPLPTLESGKVPLDQLPNSTTSTKGVVVLVNDLTAGGTDKALTAEQGKKLNDQAFGISQTWQNMTASRALATTYTNSTSRAIVVCVTGYTAAGNKLSGTVNGSVVQSFSGLSSGLTSTVTLNVPPNGTYSVTGAMEMWWELR